MKTKKFTFGIVIILFACIANFAVVQAQTPTVWDDFNIADGALTNDNGTSGAGWSDNWTYDTKTEGITVSDGVFMATDGGFGITRNITTPIPLGSSTFFVSFVVNKTETGEFRIAGLRADGIERYAVGVKADGSLFANIAQNGSFTTGDAGVVENNTTFLVVAKWWYEGGKGHMNMSAFKDGETIPVGGPTTGNWDFEKIGGATGVSVNKFRIAYSAASVNLHDFRLGDTWESVTEGTVHFVPTNIGIKATSATTANIIWADNSFLEEGFKIYKGGVEIGSVDANTTQYEATDLVSGTSYTFGVSAYKGDTETSITEQTLTFESDETPPTVTDFIPADNATDVLETSDIVITFSEDMDKASVEAAITVNPALSNPQYTWDGQTKLTITADLAYGTNYTVTISTDATDVSGNSLAAYESSFTTIILDVTPPEITETMPANGAVDVGANSDIVITFSEKVIIDTLETAITVSPALSNANYSMVGDNKVKITADNMELSTVYTITITTAVEDVKGNSFAAEQTVSFTTGSSLLQMHADFTIANGPLTNSNSAPGIGWSEMWKYTKGEGGVMVNNNYISGGTATNIVRKNANTYGIGATTFYMSFLAARSEEGSFKVLGGRQNPSNAASWQWRSGVGVNTEGALGFQTNSGAFTYDSNTGTVEADVTYLVVMKHTKGVSQKVTLFKAGDAVEEPGDGEWDFELKQGNTGVKMDYVGIDFINAAANIDEVKVGFLWEDVSTTTITDITEVPVIAPSNLEAIATSPSTLEITWSDNSIVEDGYKIFKNGNEIATVDENVSKFVLDGMTDGEVVTVGVSAYKGNDVTPATEKEFTFKFDAENYVDNDIEIASTSTAPAIDGAIDAVWANAFKNPVKRMTDGKDAVPVDDADYKCTWSAMWDNDNLYFLIEVTDETLIFNDGSGTGIGQDDGFDFPMATGTNGPMVFGRLNIIDPVDAEPSLYIHEGMAAFKNAEKAFKMTDAGYVIELSIVLREFDENIGLFVEGTKFRMDLRYNDDDTNANRDGQYTWTDKNEPGWTWNQASSLGSVTLMNDPNTSVLDNRTADLKVYTSQNGSLLNIMNYRGEAAVYDIMGRKMIHVKNVDQPINIGHFLNGIYIVKTKIGAVKFIK